MAFGTIHLGMIRRFTFALTLIALISSLALTQPPVRSQAQLQAQAFSERTIWYTSDNLRVKARIFWPNGKGPFPGIVYGHGGVDGLPQSSILRCRELARAGFAVFAPSYRGEDGGEGQIEIAKGEVNDVLNGLNIFTQDSRLDANRVAMLGTSHGALIGLLAVSRSDAFRALVFAYGISDIYTWYGYLVNTNQLGTDALSQRVFGQGPQDHPESFRIRNGLSVLETVNVPVLILQGGRDSIVPPEQAQALFDGLEALGKTAQLEVYPNSTHGFLNLREELVRKHGAKSVQARESLQAFESALKYLKQILR
jgi:dipeptidyl aminopeptidase/acylaminoacyl peptidase